MLPTLPCNSTLRGDSAAAGCQSWCKPLKASSSCRFCKCAACTFCGTRHEPHAQALAAAAALRALRALRLPEWDPPRSPAPEWDPPRSPAPVARPTTLPGWRGGALGVTSVLLPQLLAIRAQRRAIGARDLMRGTLFADDSAFCRERLPLLAYYNAGGAAREGAKPPPLRNVSWVRLEESQPWAVEYAAQHLQRTSPIQRMYRHRQLTCVMKVNATSGLCKDVVTVLKVASIFDALASSAGWERPPSTLLWLDFDTFLQRHLDERFWSWTGGLDAVSIGLRPPRNPETGVIALRPASPAVSRLVRLARAAYTTDSLRRLIGGVNDVQIFGFLMQTLAAAPTARADEAALRLGWFAVGCVARGASAPMEKWALDSRLYLARHSKLEVHYCPGDQHPHEPPTSPFNLFEFITHLKRRSGPTNFDRGLSDSSERAAPSTPQRPTPVSQPAPRMMRRRRPPTPPQSPPPSSPPPSSPPPPLPPAQSRTDLVLQWLWRLLTWFSPSVWAIDVAIVSTAIVLAWALGWYAEREPRRRRTEHEPRTFARSRRTHSRKPGKSRAARDVSLVPVDWSGFGNSS